MSVHLKKRQMRRARRKARRLGLTPKDDLEAIEMLENMGVDTTGSGKPSMLEVAAADGVVQDPDSQDIMALPAEAKQAAVVDQPKGNTLPGFVTEQERALEIERIQKELVRRRRGRFAAMVFRLLIFVILPTTLIGYYYNKIATDIYETKAEFVIQKSESGGASGMGSLFSGTGFGDSKDSIIVQGFLTSLEALKFLNEKDKFTQHFSQEWIDPIQRLPEDATEADAYRKFKQSIDVGFDPTDGIIRMQVRATDPETAEQFARSLISFAENRIDEQSQRVREDQMKGADQSYKDADLALLEAQNRVAELQEELGVFSAEAEVSEQFSLIGALELELESKRLELAAILDNARPNQTRASLVEREIGRMESRVQELRDKMTVSEGGRASLSRITAQLRIAENNLVTRQMLLQQAAQQRETARIEASRQVRYLSIGVAPIAPSEAAYPRRIENTLLAFVIFGGIYILLSLTVSILREQVSV
jgi:capsular polysaccharide transport system permease protein